MGAANVSVFIKVELDADKISPSLAPRLIAACPVNIFAANATRIHVVPENEDECTLCELCLDLAPRGSLAIKKLYKDETLLARGEAAK
jgi:NAD-dependent dihydropyrimidine dehydrogenase PreA subunit